VPRLTAAAALCAGALLCACPAPARAQEGAPPTEERAQEGAPPRPRNVQLSFLIGPRFAQLAPFSHLYSNVLTAYGYGPMSAFFEVSADAGYRFVDHLEIAAHTGYLFGSAGTSGGGGSLLTLHTIELGGAVHGVFFRGQSPWTGGLGFGVEGGVEIPFLLLRGHATSAPIPYAGPSILARFSDDAVVQPAVHVRYLVSNWSDAFGKVGLPLGGLSITVGANLSL
jgi:hypothetical protein